MNVNLLKETVTVRLDLGNEADLLVLPAAGVEVLGSTRPAKGKKPGGRGRPERPAESAALDVAEDVVVDDDLAEIEIEEDSPEPNT